MVQGAPPPSEMKPSHLQSAGHGRPDSGIPGQLEKPEARTAPGACPEFLWGPRAQLLSCTMFTLGLGSPSSQDLQ